jgi:2-polyprenyl-3-methyl-5-hydroxy-6-metoxy-1,4-benzoquinol methylase
MKTSENSVGVCEWPADGLEKVEACPVCGAGGRSSLHAGLEDDVFRCAPGKWNMWRCDSCRCAFLDPRPSSSTLHMAYAKYYTHERSIRRDAPWFQSVKRSMVNGYSSWRFGASVSASNRLGVFVGKALPFLAHIVDRTYRHLPLLDGKRGGLLDVGCGNGEFLKLAASCGWSVSGIDLDEQAVSVCTGQDLDVRRGSIDSLDDKKDAFDYITVSHVLEHVADPNRLLASCYRLLRPGGCLWIETPNIESLCHSRFGGHWRGLEAPRHLVLFNAPALEQSLASAGFRDVAHMQQPNVTYGIYRQSSKLAGTAEVRSVPELGIKKHIDCMGMLVRGFLSLRDREFILLKAVKPRS